MILTLQLIKIFSPFILLALFFCLYKKENPIIQTFCWRMATRRNAPKFFILVILMTQLFLNWANYMTAPNYAVGLSALMTGSLFFYRVADRILHRLHESNRLWLVTIMLGLICDSIPYMNSIFHVLYTLAVASVFYPSEKVLRIIRKGRGDMSPQEFYRMIIRNYY